MIVVHQKGSTRNPSLFPVLPCFQVYPNYPNFRGEIKCHFSIKVLYLLWSG